MGCRVPKHRRHMAPFDRRGCCSHCDCSNCPCGQEKKEIRIDEYTGIYTADYENFSDTAYLFGGTSIKREAGKELSIDCTLEVTEGTAKVFWISGSDKAVTLIETTGTYSDTITLPDGGNYIGIECENFTGNIELNIE